MRTNMISRTRLRKRRAWVEMDSSALIHNAKVLQRILPKQCLLMAVIKANAYGHGDIHVAKVLEHAGIKAFAVATLKEGLHLRHNGIKGEILILGYTNPEDSILLNRYQLTQTIIDLDYARSLDNSGYRIKVHLKLDTGMHRLGLDATNIKEIEKVYQLKNLKIEGIFSHLCVSDSLMDEDITYTRKQINLFFSIIETLQRKGYPTGKLHIQSSYGILNYSNLPCHYARAGIILYGVFSKNDRTRVIPDLRPVLSVRARIATVRKITTGDCVSYGRQFVTTTNRTIAVVTIGYADGIPRNLSGRDGYVLLHSKKAPILGRICMDQLIIDVTGIPEVKQNDIVTVIGRDGEEQIRCEDLAERCGTITNELLSRLGGRLDYIMN